MRNVMLFIAACLALAGVAFYYGMHRDPAPRTIMVDGECLTTAPKDRTAITLRVTTLDESAAISMRKANDIVANITKYLKTLDGVKMQTTEFNSYEKTQWNRTLEKSETVGIETSVAIEVSSDNMATIETLLIQFAGTDNVYTENLRMFTSAEALKPIIEDCLGVATQNARARAEALASGDGLHAGKMLSVSHGTNVAHQTIPAANFLRSSVKMATMDAEAYAGGGLVAKDTEVSVSVSAVFEIK